MTLHFRSYGLVFDRRYLWPGWERWPGYWYWQGFGVCLFCDRTPPQTVGERGVW